MSVEEVQDVVQNAVQAPQDAPPPPQDRIVFHLAALKQPHFGEWVRACRVRRSLTYRAVAGESGVYGATWCRIENGEDVRLSTLVKILTWAVEKGLVAQ